MRIAVVEKDRCQPKRCNFECHHFCPIVRQGKPCVWMGDDHKAKISETLCIGCNICVVKCPFDAIHIINLPEELKEDLMVQYGENAFRLYRLPVPREGQITGLLGPNGIGKTTALRILSGQEVPNLGDWKREASWQPAIDRYSGTELGEFLKKVASGGLKTALKPQYVDKLSQAAKGRVRELLEKNDERGKMRDVVDALELGGVLDSDIGTLSGGELQRVAIAGTALKDADVYFFDEPSSYLDIRQRLRAARLIRRLATERSVVLVEHDLAVLDFLADQVHLLYGTAAAYGIVTVARPVRSAINTYLEGFLREENIRFRDAPIRFEAHPPREEWRAGTLLRFPALTYRYERFELRAHPGEIRIGEVVGVVGPNATGKTTFVRMLAKELTAASGVVEAGAKVSYKPQYVRADVSGSVQDLLYNALAGEADQPFFQHEIAHPLDLQRLATKDVEKLSGGELQRVAVALCLAREADLYLLDEPSAYMDVEQRMIVAKTIRRVMEKRGKSALVVDHDVYFVDLLADRVMVFTGEAGTKGSCSGPFEMREGMNKFLADVGVTFRRDKESQRPRVNKAGSRMDSEQRASGEYYYLQLVEGEE